MKPVQYPTIHIKGIHFKNPFVLLPGITELTNPTGRVTPELLMHYKALTRSEAALILTGPATIVPPNSRKYSLLRVDQPKYLDGLRALSKIIISNGAIPGIQITHPAGYEANELIARTPTYRDTLAGESPEKIITAFRNACVRALEVGFRFIELDGRGCLGLHQLCVADQEEVIREIFSNGVKAVGSDSILALRLDPHLARRDSYAKHFLDLGGDLLSLDMNGQDEAPFFEANQGACIEHLYGQVTPNQILTRLNRCRLLSINPSGLEKTRSVASLS